MKAYCINFIFLYSLWCSAEDSALLPQNLIRFIDQSGSFTSAAHFLYTEREILAQQETEMLNSFWPPTKKLDQTKKNIERIDSYLLLLFKYALNMGMVQNCDKIV